MERIGYSALSRRGFLGLVGAGTAGALLGACGGSKSAGNTSSPSGGKKSTTTLPSFPLGAAKKASGVVTITMWHSMSGNNLKTLEALASSYNKSQSKIHVKLLAQSSYTDTFTAYRTALGNPTTLPALVQIETINLQDMIDSQSIVPAGAALKADGSFDSADVIPAAMSYFTVDGLQYAMPWNCSAQIMYYNKATFSKAGLDPNRSPSSFTEYHDMAAQAKSKAAIPYGTAIKLTASNVEDWLAKSGALMLNNGNGRAARATAAEFGGSTGREIMSFLSGMFTSKVAEATLATNYDNLVAIGAGTAAMTIDTSAALGTVLALLFGGEYHNVKLGVGPLPGIDGLGEGVPYGGAGLYIVKAGSPEQQDASWEFIKYLLTPSAMATWAIGSGYIPITKSSVATAAMKHAWSQTPQLKVAYEEISSSVASKATAGAVSGALAQIETNIGNVLSKIATGLAPAAALSSAVASSNQAIAAYNSSVG